MYHEHTDLHVWKNHVSKPWIVTSNMNRDEISSTRCPSSEGQTEENWETFNRATLFQRREEHKQGKLFVFCKSVRLEWIEVMRVGLTRAA
jgi:hypothetical protein